MILKVPIIQGDYHQTNRMMRELAHILFPQGQRLPMPYTVDSNSTHYIVEVDTKQIDITEEQKKQLMLWRLKL